MEFQRVVKFVSSCCHDHILLKYANFNATFKESKTALNRLFMAEVYMMIILKYYRAASYFTMPESTAVVEGLFCCI